MHENRETFGPWGRGCGERTVTVQVRQIWLEVALAVSLTTNGR